jgi:hypothetical protein
MLTDKQIQEVEEAAADDGLQNTKHQTPNANPVRAGQRMLIGSAAEHAELGRDYLRAEMPGFALKHLREAVARLEQAEAVGGAKAARTEDGRSKTATTNQQGLIEI